MNHLLTNDFISRPGVYYILCWMLVCSVSLYLFSCPGSLVLPSVAEPNNDSPLNVHAADLWSNQTVYKKVLLEKYDREVRGKYSLWNPPGTKTVIELLTWSCSRQTIAARLLSWTHSLSSNPGFHCRAFAMLHCNQDFAMQPLQCCTATRSWICTTP